MIEPVAPTEGVITVHRLLTYIGPLPWVEKTMQSSFVPLSGEVSVGFGTIESTPLTAEQVERVQKGQLT